MTTTDYTGRQVDLELLQSIQGPSVSAQRVYVDNVDQNAPKMVTGIEKAVQRYTQMLMTTSNDVFYYPALGGPLIAALKQGQVGDPGSLTHFFCVSNANALAAIAKDDEDATFGTIPDDERIVSAVLMGLEFSPTNSMVQISVQITTAAGSDYTFVVPITTGA